MLPHNPAVGSNVYSSESGRLARRGERMKGMRMTLLAGLVLSLAAVTARAQEPAEDEEARPEPVRKIRVLENPYDIASFYRSHQGDYFGLQAPGASERYPIAGFYRQNG